MPGKRTVRRYEDENHTLTEKNHDDFPAYQTSAPNTAAATSVSPLDPSGSSKTKFSKTRTDIYQTVTDNIIAALEAV
jgi:hypothetical protein